MSNSDSFRLVGMCDLDLRIEFNSAAEEDLAKAQDLRLSAKAMGMILVVY